MSITFDGAQGKAFVDGTGRTMMLVQTLPMRKALSMPTTRAMLGGWQNAAKCRVVLVQHALRDTAIFIKEVRNRGVTVDGLVAKPNSIDQSVIRDLRNDGILVLEEPPGYKPYEYFGASNAIGDLLKASLEKARATDARSVFIDVGGHLLRHFHSLPQDLVPFIAGVVEVTTLGHHVYSDGASCLPFPVLSIARSPLKDAEAVSVGDSAIRATEDILQDVGRLLPGMSAGVIGYGMIGRRVARAAHRRGLRVSVYDTDAVASVAASLDGFPVPLDLADLLSDVDLVFSATGRTAVYASDAKSAKAGQVWFSVGSRAREFDVEGLANMAIRRESLGNYLEEYALPVGGPVILSNKGKAVNFLKDGTPEEAMDIVFAETATCMQLLAEGGVERIGEVSELGSPDRRKVAAAWLGSRRPNCRNVAFAVV